jgi:predicted nucleic acid-binding protein
MLRAGLGDVSGALGLACAGVGRHPLSEIVVDRARTIGPANLRSLDAIHLSAAVALGATEMLTFDRRLADAAESVGVRAIP